MYNIIIADDEASIREGITKLIQLVFPKLNIQKVCTNGKEVIDTVKLGMTDILIMDINMPISTGIDVARYIYENKLDIHVIMITGYAKFEYAKAAINYNVDRFLTKPFESESLINVVNVCIADLDKKGNSAHSQTQNYLQNYAKNKDLLTLGYSGVINTESLNKHRLFFKEKDLEELYVCELIFYLNVAIVDDKFTENLSGFGEFSCDEFESYLINSKENSFTFAIILPQRNTSVPQRISAEIKHSFCLFYDMNIESEIGPMFNFEEWLIHCKENSIADSYINNLADKRFAHAGEEAGEYLIGLSENRRTEFLKLLISKVNEHFHILSEISTDNFASFHKDITLELSKSYDIIEQIKGFVNKNFANANISLYNISQQLHMNETYLSRIFKEKTGQKFVDYLIEVRIANAKKLLSTGKYNITEVAHLVGYSQTKYFRTVFKRITGITASEYIKRSVLGGYDL